MMDCATPLSLDIGNPSASGEGAIYHDAAPLIRWLDRVGVSIPASAVVLAEAAIAGYPVAVLKGIRVEDEARGQGLGSALLSSFIESAGECSLAVLACDRLEQNPFDLGSWYQRHGFEMLDDLAGDAPVMIRRS